LVSGYSLLRLQTPVTSLSDKLPPVEWELAEEVAAGVVFLSSPVASRINGTNLLIDGALTKGMQF
jgi:NAD(P)-dependent dehydrogenase (short-subunit alcohol dehydrogenase family)